MKLSHGFRSRFELEFAQHLAKNNIKYDYDFHLELKGNLDVTDRVKHLLVKEQNPHLDVRFIFPNSKKKIYKGSKTSYASWCDRHGFLYADNRIPKEWLK